MRSTLFATLVAGLFSPLASAQVLVPENDRQDLMVGIAFWAGMESADAVGANAFRAGWVAVRPSDGDPVDTCNDLHMDIEHTVHADTYAFPCLVDLPSGRFFGNVMGYNSTAELADHIAANPAARAGNPVAEPGSICRATTWDAVSGWHSVAYERDFYTLCIKNGGAGGYTRITPTAE
jgi:hypothetical protein